METAHTKHRPILENIGQTSHTEFDQPMKLFSKLTKGKKVYVGENIPEDEITLNERVHEDNIDIRVENGNECGEHLEMDIIIQQGKN